MKKIITLSLLLILYSQNAFSKIIIFNCSDILGDFYHTFRIDMNKKIVDGDLEFDKGSTENVVYAASYEEIEDSTYIGRLHELRLEEKISYLHLLLKLNFSLQKGIFFYEYFTAEKKSKR